MSCQKCNSPRVISIWGKVSDCFLAVCESNNKEYEGYVPNDLGIGDDSGDYIKFKYCAECGTIQGKFPLEKTSIEEAKNESEIRYVAILSNSK